MRKLILTIVLMFSATVSAQGIFPDQPVDMKPGYGANGAGMHLGIPYGLPGNDCVINPVSMTHMIVTQAVTIVTPGTIITIPATVLFDFDGDLVRPNGKELLRTSVYTALVNSNVNSIEIIGHTDSKGTEIYNEGLGLRRASAVATVLTMLGFDGDITVGTGGELQPIASNTNTDGSDNPVGRQENRRVAILVSSVEDIVGETTEEIIVGRNPQIFHRLSSNGTVACNGTRLGLYGPHVYRYRY